MDCSRSSETVLESFTAVVECSVTECATRAVVSRSEWRNATVWSLAEEKGCRPEVLMLSGIDVSCIADSSVGGIVDPSAMAAICTD